MDPVLLILAAALSGGLVVYSVGRRNATTVWNARARTRTKLRKRLGLVEVDAPDRPEGRKPMTGTHEGFTLTLDYVQNPTLPFKAGDARASDQLDLSIALSPLYRGVTVAAETLAKRLTKDMATGDRDADRELLIYGPERRVVAIMGASRRGALRQAVRAGFEVRECALKLSVPDDTSASDVLEHVRAALRFARRIDVQAPGHGRPLEDRLLAENVSTDPLVSVRQRSAVLLFAPSEGSEHVAKALAKDLIASEPADLEALTLQLRAASYLRDARAIATLLAAAAGPLDVESISVALQGLAASDVVEAASEMALVIRLLTDDPVASPSVYHHAATALRRRCDESMPEDVEEALSAIFQRDPLAASGAFCPLLADIGTPRSVGTLLGLPRRVSKVGRHAARAIQERHGGQRGMLALASEEAEDDSLGSLAIAPQEDGAVTVASPKVWAVVPAKAFVEAKSRLASVLDFTERAKLAASLLGRLLVELNHSDLGGVLVATASTEVAEMARRHMAEVIADGDRQGVSDVVDGALALLARRGVQQAVVVMADLPLFDRTDCRAMANALGPGTIVVAPDRRRGGANAVAVELPPPFRLPFGREDSFQAHLDAAASAGCAALEHNTPGGSLDLDTPEDLQAWRLGIAPSGAPVGPDL